MPDYYLISIWGLYTRLRREGMSLGVSEYLDALKALNSPLARNRESDLSFVETTLKSLWTTSKEDEIIFDHYFELVVEEFGKMEIPEELRLPENEPENQPDPEVDPQQNQEPDSNQITDPDYKDPGESGVDSRPATSNPETSAEIAARLRGDLIISPQVRERFEISDNYLPVGPRAMKQAWRFLRRLRPEGPASELDVEATLENIAENGFLLEPVMKQRMKIHAEITLLIDRRGSMLPFHILEDKFVEAATQGLRVPDEYIFYFHNVPFDYVYKDKSLRERFPVSEFLGKINQQDDPIVIFSDGGAARGSLNPERIQAMTAFIRTLQLQTRRLVWINPMPPERWEGSSAEYLASLIPMVPFSRAGITKAVDILRGKPVLTSVEQNRK
ncbi:MAG: hypothetical protein H6581_16070 [Bacteroidia bacterium]|nr:hypothetical protein [Bacteroidia bacterium]